MRIVVAIALFCLGSICCKAPNTTVRAVDGRSTLKVVGAPVGAILCLDGRQMGGAEDFAGDPNVLAVEPGTHLIEIKKDGQILISQRVFFGGGEMRSINVPREVK